MSAPYEPKPFTVATVGGESTTEMVPFAGRAWISKVIVTQVSGPPGNFTVELFNHKDAMEGTEQSDSSSTDAGDRVPLENYRVSPPLNGVNGQLRYFSEETTGGSGLLFVCQDENPNRQKSIQRNLYLRITPDGAGAKKFCVTIGGDSDVG